MLNGPTAKIQRLTSKSKIPNYSSLSKVSTSLVDQIIDPSSITDVVRWPNTYGLSATYKCRNVIKAKYDYMGNGLVVVHPRIGSGIHVTNGDFTGEAILGDGSDLNSHLSITQHISSSTKTSIAVTEPMCKEDISIYPTTNPSGSLVYYNPFRTVDGTLTENGVPWWPVPAAHPDGRLQILPQGIVGLGKTTLKVEWLQKDMITPLPAGAASGDGLAQSTIISNILATAPITISQPTAANTGYLARAYFIKLSLECDYEAVDSQFTFSFLAPDAGKTLKYILPNVSTLVKAESLKDADTIQRDCDKFMVIAQSLLVTSQMASNNNSGQLSIARLPGGTTLCERQVANTPPYEWLASLPYNSYNGPVKHGAYCFYIPDDERGYQYQQIGAATYKGLPYMACAYYAPDSAHSIRLQIDTIVQFTTCASLYQLSPSPQLSDIQRVHYMISALQAAYTNDGHIEGLKKHLAKLGGQIKKQLLTPSNWVNAGKAVAKYGPAVAGALLI